MEEQERNLSKQFKPSSTFIDLDSSEKKDKDETRLFELSEFLGTRSNRGFSFDSENARNFDADNINKAKQGHPATGAGQPGGSYYEKTSAGYTGYAHVPAN